MSEKSDQPPKEFGWTLPQRRALLVLLLILLIALSIQYALHPVFVDNPAPADGARSRELATRIDPNTADWQTLAAIPTLGEKRARQIVAYREQARHGDSTAIVFHDAGDLMRVKGIGPATADNLRPYLIFPAAAVQDSGKE